MTARVTAAEPCLVADIGGTNARFALATATGDDRVARLWNRQNRPVARFETLRDAASDYLATLPTRPTRAVFAVAGPVAGEYIQFSNNPWHFVIAELRAALGLESLEIINDFQAVATAAIALTANDLEAIGPARPFPDGPHMRLVLGTGTGLGVAAVHMADDRTVVLASEGGHRSFSPHDEVEDHLLHFLRARHGRVSAERLLSGDGLIAIYQAGCTRLGRAPTLTTAASITAAAATGDADAAAATRTFCNILGCFAGDAVLMFNAWGGVQLAGDMLARLLDADGMAAFRRRFREKGRFAEQISTVPTWRITRNDIGELGAAVHDVRHRQSATIAQPETRAPIDTSV